MYAFDIFAAEEIYLAKYTIKQIYYITQRLLKKGESENLHISSVYFTPVCGKASRTHVKPLLCGDRRRESTVRRAYGAPRDTTVPH